MTPSLAPFPPAWCGKWRWIHAGGRCVLIRLLLSDLLVATEFSAESVENGGLEGTPRDSSRSGLPPSCRRLAIRLISSLRQSPAPSIDSWAHVRGARLASNRAEAAARRLVRPRGHGASPHNTQVPSSSTPLSPVRVPLACNL